MAGKPFYEFGPFRLDPAERQLLRENNPVALTPKCFDLLVALVEDGGHLVGKEQLLERLWPNQFVEESNLSFNISVLRKALGDGRNGQRYIETVPKKGFRLVAPVTIHSDSERGSVVGDETEAAQSERVPEIQGEDATSLDGAQGALGQTWLSRHSLSLAIVAGVLAFGLLGSLVLLRKRWTAPVEPPVKTIAVLPFKPLSADSRDQSLEMGMTETLITRLSNLNQIVVRPMSAVRKYDNPQQDPVKAGQELQTDAILDGNIQRAGDRVRVSVRLTKVSNGASLWAGQFDENFSDIFKVQDSISVRVVNALPLKLSGAEQGRLSRHYTDSPEAYELYLQGLYYRMRGAEGDQARSSECYQRALEKDPKFALVYVEMAELELAHTGANQIPANETRPKVIANLTKALELDDSLAEAHNIFGEVKYQDQFDWTGAEKEFKRAIELNPNVASIHQAYGWYLMCEGRFDEATKELERAQQIDPRALIISVVKGRLLYFMRQYDAALQHEQRLLELEPNAGVNHWAIGLVYEQKRMYAEAVEENARAGQVDGLRLSPQEIAAGKDAFKTAGWQGYIRQRLNLLQQKAKAVYVSPFSIAVNYARLGSTDEALAWLEKAIDARASGVSGLKIDPVLDSLRSDPGFAKLLQRMNLTP